MSTPVETHAAVQRLLRFADNPVRAARIARLARGVAESTGDEFFRYLAYAIDTHADANRGFERDGICMSAALRRERDSLILTAFAQVAPR